MVYDGALMENLPPIETVLADAERLVKELQALIDAPVVEPYIGPAILLHRASGVFFHEIFGHRIEATARRASPRGRPSRRRSASRFFLSSSASTTIHHGPLREHRSARLLPLRRRRHAGRRVTVVDHGILRNFLTTRSPIENFPSSNGHGRREYGNDIVARQGNLIVQSDKTVPFDELRRALIAECQRQGKPYGLVFGDISGASP